MSPIEKQNQARQIATDVITGMGGSLGSWERSGALGLWDYAQGTLGDFRFSVGVSGGLVVSINGQPFDPDFKVNDNHESVKKSLAQLKAQYERIFGQK